MPQLDLHGYVVPETPYRETDGFDKLADILNQNKRWGYQLQKDKENDDWRKANLIQHLTDLSDYKTGSDVADAVGNHLMSNIFQKYTSGASKMSPLELQAGIQKDMSGIVTGMNGIKDELSTADKQGAALKQMYPNLNSAQLYDDYRKEIVNRHLDDGGDNFKNPMQVGQSSFNLEDPDFLSKYITGQSNIRDYFANPKGVDDTTVFKGSPYSFTEYKAKLTPWRTPNYDASQLKEGFLPNNSSEPSLGYKTTILPPDALPSSKHVPFEIMDNDVYKNLGPKEKLELTSAARQKFPTYDNFSPTEKDYAQRNVMAEMAKTFDQTNFHPTERKNPSAAMTKIFMGDMGGKKGGETDVNDIYNRVDGTLADREKQGQSFLPVALLDPDAKDIIVTQAQKKDKDLTEKDLQIIRGSDGSIRVFDINGDFVNYVKKVSTNIKAQPGVKEKREVIKEGNTQPTEKTKGKFDNL